MLMPSCTCAVSNSVDLFLLLVLHQFVNHVVSSDAFYCIKEFLHLIFANCIKIVFLLLW